MNVTLKLELHAQLGRWLLYSYYNFDFSDAEGATFTGDSHISYDLSGSMQWIQMPKDHVKLRFRTSQPDGLVLFADGNQGDYFILEMVGGKLYLHIDLGKRIEVPLSF